MFLISSKSQDMEQSQRQTGCQCTFISWPCCSSKDSGTWCMQYWP